MFRNDIAKPKELYFAAYSFQPKTKYLSKNYDFIKLGEVSKIETSRGKKVLG